MSITLSQYAFGYCYGKSTMFLRITKVPDQALHERSRKFLRYHERSFRVVTKVQEMRAA